MKTHFLAFCLSLACVATAAQAGTSERAECFDRATQVPYRLPTARALRLCKQVVNIDDTLSCYESALSIRYGVSPNNAAVLCSGVVNVGATLDCYLERGSRTRDYDAAAVLCGR